jgi:predicted dehydrogenase
MKENSPKVLVVGVGSIGERHVRCFRGAGAEVSVCDTNSALRERMAKQYEVRGHESLENALAAGIDAAVIAAPAQLHIPLALPLARAGVHLLIEKPLAVDLSLVGQLQCEVAKHNVTVAVAYVYRAHPALAAMKQAIDAGRFGRPLQIVATCGQHFPHYRPAYREIYYRDRATGGGAIQDALTHVVNAGEWLVGPIDRLIADAAHQALPGVEVEDTVHLLTRQGGVLGSYSLNQHQAPNEATIQVNCESGTARFEFHAHRWRRMAKPDQGWTDENHGPLERDALFIAQAKSFLAALRGEGAPLCSLDEGVQTLRSNIAALASCASGGWRFPASETESNS